MGDTFLAPRGGISVLSVTRELNLRSRISAKVFKAFGKAGVDASVFLTVTLISRRPLSAPVNSISVDSRTSYACSLSLHPIPPELLSYMHSKPCGSVRPIYAY